MNKLYASASGVSNITEVRLIEDYNSSTTRAEITCASTSLDLNDTLALDMGYQTSHGQVFYGYVKGIRTNVPAFTQTIEAHDVLIRAVDNFIAADDSQNPLQYENTAAEDVVADLLSKSQVSNYTGDVSNFTFGVDGPIKVNLISAYDMINQICELLAFDIYADHNGNVFFKQRPPRPVGGETPSWTFSTANQNIVVAEYAKSTDNLRNRVVVYGDQTANVFASASASSPYLPANFYQTTAIASQYIQTQAQAQQTADYNLDLLNHLTETARVRVIGDYTHHVRNVATLSESFTGLSGDWLIHSMQSMWTRSGYTSELTLTK